MSSNSSRGGSNLASNHMYTQSITIASLLEEELRNLKDGYTLANLPDNPSGDPITPVFSSVKICTNATFNDFGSLSILGENQMNFGRGSTQETSNGPNNRPSIQDNLFDLGSCGSIVECEDSGNLEDIDERSEYKVTTPSDKKKAIPSKNDVLNLLEYSRKNQKRSGNDSNIGIFGTFKISELRKYLHEY